MKLSRISILITAVFLCFSCSGNEKKEIKASEILKLLKKGEAVQIVDKIILDDLDFVSAKEPFLMSNNTLQTEITSNIFFSNCVFMGKVTTNGQKEKFGITSVFKNNVSFVGCDFRGEVNFENAVIFGSVNFSKSIFRKNTSFNGIAIWSKDSYFSEVKAEDDFSMIYSSVLGNLYFINARFDKNASFQEISVKGKLSFNNATFQQSAGLDLIEVYERAFFNYVTFEKEANFSNSKFFQTAEFVNAKFNAKGNFEKTFFLNTARFDGVDTEKDLILTETFFGNKK